MLIVAVLRALLQEIDVGSIDVIQGGPRPLFQLDWGGWSHVNHYEVTSAFSKNAPNLSTKQSTWLRFDVTFY